MHFKNTGTAVYSPQYAPDSIGTRYIQKVLSMHSKFAQHGHHIKKGSGRWNQVPKYLQVKSESL